MESELDKFEKDLYLRTLQKSSYYRQLLDYNNFEKQKSKVSILHISEKIQSLIDLTLQDKCSRIIPVVASSEKEKSQYFDLLKSRLNDFQVVYIPSPPIDVTINFHVYTCIIEELGFGILEEVSRSLVKKYSKDERPNLDNIINIGIEDFTGKRFKCFKALIYYQLIPSRRNLVKKWLILDELTDDEIKQLGIKSFEESVKAFELTKIIAEFSERPIILYFDDIEVPYEEYGEIGLSKIFEALKRLHHDVKNLIILMISKRKPWDKIKDISDDSFLSILEPEQNFYDLETVEKFIHIAMDIYWVQYDIKPPEYPFFPLSEQLLKKFFRKLRGDVKSFLNLCIKSIEEIGSGEITLEELLEDKKKETNLVM